MDFQHTLRAYLTTDSAKREDASTVNMENVAWGVVDNGTKGWMASGFFLLI
jgi:hypothetical protein